MSPALTATAILIAVTVCLSAAVALRRRAARRHHAALPKGAEAILWAVTEVLPDPRNHLAIKDPTSELRLTDEERRAAAEAIQPRLIGGYRPAQRASAEKLKAARVAALEKHDRLVRSAI